MKFVRWNRPMAADFHLYWAVHGSVKTPYTPDRGGWQVLYNINDHREFSDNWSPACLLEIALVTGTTGPGPQTSTEIDDKGQG